MSNFVKKRGQSIGGGKLVSKPLHNNVETDNTSNQVQEECKGKDTSLIMILFI